MIQNWITMFRTSAVQFQNLRYFYTTFGGIQVNHFGQLILKFDSQVTRCEKSRRKSDIILSLRIQDKTIMEKQQHMLLIVINHQSDQLKNRKFYKYQWWKITLRICQLSKSSHCDLVVWKLLSCFPPAWNCWIY